MTLPPLVIMLAAARADYLRETARDEPVQFDDEKHGGLDDPNQEETPRFKPSRPAEKVAERSAHVILTAAQQAAGKTCPCLACARSELRAETPVRMTQIGTPNLRDADGQPTKDPDESGIGPPLTSAMHRLLGIKEYDPKRGEPKDYLMRRSLIEVDDWCQAQHSHDGVCGLIVTRAVRSGWETPDIAVAMGYPEVSVRSLLAAALAHAADFRQGRATRRPRTAADLVIEEADRRQRRRVTMSYGSTPDLRTPSNRDGRPIARPTTG